MTVAAKWQACSRCGCTDVLVTADYEGDVLCNECVAEPPPMFLQRSTYYSMPRDEDGRRSRQHDVVFEAALRWHPEFPDALAEGFEERGAGLLRRLGNGDKISESELHLIGVYLLAAVDYYTTAPEPYPQRNREAITDMRRMAELVLP